MLSHLEEFRSFLEFSFHFDFWRTLKGLYVDLFSTAKHCSEFRCGRVCPQGQAGGDKKTYRPCRRGGRGASPPPLPPWWWDRGHRAGWQQEKPLLGLSRESSLQVGVQRMFAERVALSCVNRVKGCSCVPSARTLVDQTKIVGTHQVASHLSPRWGLLVVAHCSEVPAGPWKTHHHSLPAPGFCSFVVLRDHLKSWDYLCAHRHLSVCRLVLEDRGSVFCSLPRLSPQGGGRTAGV